MNNIVKYFIYILLVLFAFLYFFGSSVYQGWLKEKKELTTEQIKKFEKDIKDGVEIDIEEYVVKEKNYNNIVTNINSNISKIIEKGFKKVFEYLIKNIEV